MRKSPRGHAADIAGFERAAPKPRLMEDCMMCIVNARGYDRAGERHCAVSILDRGGAARGPHRRMVRGAWAGSPASRCRAGRRGAAARDRRIASLVVGLV